MIHANSEDSGARPVAADAVARTVRENAESRSSALEDIKRQYEQLIRMRDRRIEELEQGLAPLQFFSNFDTGDANRLDLKLLIVEGSRPERKVLVAALRPRFHVLSTGDGYEALELLADDPDLILTELNLPSVDGIRLIHQIREMCPGTPLLIMSAAANMNLTAQLRALNVEVFIPKPCRTGAILAAVESAAQTCKPTLKRVLVFCPDMDECRAFVTLLDERYQILAAASPAEALKMVRARPDAIIVDVTSDDFEWESTLAAFAKLHSGLKVLAIADPQKVQPLAPNSPVTVDAVIMRPYRYADVLARLRTLLGMRDTSKFLNKVFRAI